MLLKQHIPFPFCILVVFAGFFAGNFQSSKLDNNLWNYWSWTLGACHKHIQQSQNSHTKVYHANWRPIQGSSGGPSMESGDWRDQLQPDSRTKAVNKIMETLKQHLPFPDQDELHELKKVAVSFEEKVYTTTTSQFDYLRRISLMMLSWETGSQNSMPDDLQANNGLNPLDQGSMAKGHQPSISDMARHNVSCPSGGTHSYSHDQSAPSWNALNKRDSSSMMIESDNVQQFAGDEFGWNDLSDEVSSKNIVQGKGRYTFL